jgi:hypothetical protein
MRVKVIRSKDGGGYVVIAQGFGFVTRSCLLRHAAAVRMAARLRGARS